MPNPYRPRGTERVGGGGPAGIGLATTVRAASAATCRAASARAFRARGPAVRARGRGSAVAWWCCGSAYRVRPITAASVTTKPSAASHSRPGWILSPRNSRPTIGGGHRAGRVHRGHRRGRRAALHGEAEQQLADAASARSAGTAAGWRRTRTMECAEASGRAAIAAAENAMPGQRAERDRAGRAVQPDREEADHRDGGEPDQQRDQAAGADRACRRRLAPRSPARSMPPKSRSEQRDLGAGQLPPQHQHAEQRGHAEPRGAAACTRNSGRSRRARKASTKPTTWQPRPNR